MRNQETIKMDREQLIRKLARKVTNNYIKFAHTATLSKLLSEFNYHYSTKVERSREELIQLVKQERNRVLWHQEIVK